MNIAISLIHLVEHKKYKKMATLEKAISIAVEAHKGQVDKFNQPYIHALLHNSKYSVVSQFNFPIPF